ncbi:hypothetical protein GCM10009547_10820 [Sporichthya brevicatena]|uniref:Flavodoxin-like domain-containing protein n=1 Tax=Sporichthya brevicatena TaxID=171442 RepID=A0ABN1GFS1_9ACTN
MSARVLVAYAASAGFTARHAADVASEIAEVGGLEVDVKPITYVASIEPYVAVYLGWSSQSGAGQRAVARFLERNAPHLADRRIWVVQRKAPGEGSARGGLRLSRLLVRNGVAAEAFAGTGTHRRSEVLPTIAPAVPGPSPAGDEVIAHTRPISA